MRSNTITAMNGAASSNAIAQTATASIEAGDAAALAAVAQKPTEREGWFVAAHQPSGKFSIDITPAANKIDIKVTGASAHGSRPEGEREDGAAPDLVRCLRRAMRSRWCRPINTPRPRVIVNGVFGLDYFNNALKLAYADDFMGPLTISPNFIKPANGQLEVYGECAHAAWQVAQLKAEGVEKGIASWSTFANVPVKIDYTQGNWMARDPKGAWRPC